MLTFVLYNLFFCNVINRYLCNISVLLFTLMTTQALSFQGKNNTCVPAASTSTHTPPHTQTHIFTHCHSQTRVIRRLYVRLRVWKILDIWSMTGPVSGSFIHWVLFSGFSSMSSNAAHKKQSHFTITAFKKNLQIQRDTPLTLRNLSWFVTNGESFYCIQKTLARTVWISFLFGGNIGSRNY